jgi:hypothetical protein
MTKLTLSMTEEDVKTAKRLAKERGTSVSAMVVNFVRGVARAKSKPFKIGPITRKATGLAHLPPGKTADDLRFEALKEKYGPF